MPTAAADAASVAMPRAEAFRHKKNVQIRLIKKINFPVEYQIAAAAASAGRVKNVLMREDKRNNDERKIHVSGRKNHPFTMLFRFNVNYKAKSFGL